MILHDVEIERLARAGMIENFAPCESRPDVISYGLIRVHLRTNGIAHHWPKTFSVETSVMCGESSVLRSMT